MNGPYPICPDEQTVALALRIVGWAVSEQGRAERMLALTGLDPQTLRTSLGDPATLRALVDFVLDHEPDLIACAQALDVEPAAIVAMRAAL